MHRFLRLFTTAISGLFFTAVLLCARDSHGFGRRHPSPTVADNPSAASVPSPASPPYPYESKSCVVGHGGSDDVMNTFYNSPDSAILNFKNGISASALQCTVNSAQKATSGQSIQAQNLDQLHQGLQNSTHVPKIKTACIEASLNRGNDSTSFSCDSEASKAKKVPANQCMTRAMVDYLQNSVQNGIECMKNAAGVDIDPLLAFKILNNESGFKFFIVNNGGDPRRADGGRGLGQVISSTAQDISERGPNFASMFEKIQKSDAPECRDFRNVMKEDESEGSNLKSDLKLNYCKTLSPGMGLQRNIIYSLIYQGYLKQSLSDSIVASGLVGSSSELQSDPEKKEVFEKLILSGYGPAGPGGAIGILKSARSFEALKNYVNAGPTGGKKRGSKGSSNLSRRYINDVEEKYGEVLGLLPAGSLKRDDMEDACIEK